MGARYLLRFDDVCPTQRWSVWNRIESKLEALRIAPILAIVPDNGDVHLMVEPPIEDFWARAQSWRDQGWAIGLHGHRHTYVTEDPGILGINRFSEFSGLPQEQQQAKLEASVEVLSAHGLLARLWIAPAHSFDQGTVRALQNIGIAAISDGFFPRPGLDKDGMLWLPQQLWRPRQMPFGVWTICLHVNSMTESAVGALIQFAEAHRESFVTFDDMVHEYSRRRLSAFDHAFAAAYRLLLINKRRLGGLPPQ